MTEWRTIDSCPEGIEVKTKIDDDKNGVRNIQNLVQKTRIPGETRPMYWYPDGSMYVYYEPTHWAFLDGNGE